MSPQHKVCCGTLMVASLAAHRINKGAWEGDEHGSAFAAARSKLLVHARPAHVLLCQNPRPLCGALPLRTPRLCWFTK